MHIDGSYGRLKAHNERMKDLRRRKKDGPWSFKFIRSRKEDRIQDSEADPDTMRRLKMDLRNKSIKRRKREIGMLTISLVLAIVIAYLFATFVFDK